MFYVIETNYVGPNQGQGRYVDTDKIEISTSPALTNLSQEERTEGWCGTTNGWAVFAHGAYGTLKEARAAIAAKFGEVRAGDPSGANFEPDNGSVIATYKPGLYTPLSRETTADLMHEAIQADIAADTTDARISELAEEYEAEANSNGCTLHSDLTTFMQQRRQELRDQQEDES